MEGHKLCAVAVAIVAVAAGCGDGDDAAGHACKALATGTQAGTCTDGARRYVYSGPHGSVRLPELRIRYRKWASIDIFKSPAGRRIEAEGRYVVVTVAVTNLTDQPQTLGSPHRHTRLVFEGRTYHEASRALNGAASQTGFDRPLPPGATVERAFIYDMPSAVADTLPNGRGAIEVAAFSEPDVDRAKELAVVRMGNKPLIAEADG